MNKSKTKIKSGWDVKKLLTGFVVILAVILLFTLVDYFTHQLRAEYAVPSWYFRNKIIFGTIIAFITWLFVRNKSPGVKALVISAVTSILLQIRYYLLGYSLDFVLLFLVIHFLILLSVSYLAFRVLEQ
jgi:uncharacterized membrane protein